MTSTPKTSSATKRETGKKGRANSIDGHVGLRLRQRRSLLGLSQEKLADSVGITFQQIQKYENGANRISASRLFQLSQILKIPVSYFFEQYDGKDATGKKIKAGNAGFADNKQETITKEDDILHRKETLELIRVYYSIESPKLRKDLFKLVKSMADNMRSQDQ